MNTRNILDTYNNLVGASPSQLPKAKIWQHAFSLNSDANDNFVISFQRDLTFYVLAIVAFIFSIPLLYTTMTSFQSIIVDPFEPAMIFFNLFLSTVRMFFIKILFNYIRDGYREIKFCSFDNMISIKNQGVRFYKSKIEIFHLSDIEGIEIEILKDNDLQASGSYETLGNKSDDNNTCEISMKVKDGRNIILLPYLSSVQEARNIAWKISNKTSLKMLTNVVSLFQ